jgi:hypothetical protein
MIASWLSSRIFYRPWRRAGSLLAASLGRPSRGVFLSLTEIFFLDNSGKIRFPAAKALFVAESEIKSES